MLSWRTDFLMVMLMLNNWRDSFVCGCFKFLPFQWLLTMNSATFSFVIPKDFAIDNNQFIDWLIGYWPVFLEANFFFLFFRGYHTWKCTRLISFKYKTFFEINSRFFFHSAFSLEFLLPVAFHGPNENPHHFASLCLSAVLANCFSFNLHT